MEHYSKSSPWVKYAMDAAAGASAPAATNVAPPAPAAMPSPGGDAQRMQKDSDAIRYAKLEDEIKQLRDFNASLSRERDQAECERLVTQLEAEGYSLSRPREVAKLLKMSADDRAEHVAYARKTYQRGPVGGLIRTYDGPATPGVATPSDVIGSEAEYREFTAYCRENSITDFDKGRAEFKKAKGK